MAAGAATEAVKTAAPAARCALELEARERVPDPKRWRAVQEAARELSRQCIEAAAEALSIARILDVSGAAGALERLGRVAPPDWPEDPPAWFIVALRAARGEPGEG